VYLLWYGLGRAAIETIRLDPSESFLGIRVNVWAAFAAILLGLIILYVQARRHPGIEPGAYVAGREPSSDDKVGATSTYTAEELAVEAETSKPRPGATSTSR
jgi:hypothetical protein